MYLSVGPLSNVATSTAHRTWQELRLSLPWAHAILRSCDENYHIRRASTVSISKPQQSRTPGLPFENNPNVHPDNLRDTLEAHREANRASLISKVSPAGRRLPISLEPQIPQDQEPDTKPKFKTHIHVKVKKTSRDERRKLRRDKLGFDYEGASRSLTTQWKAKASSTLQTRIPWWTPVSPVQDSPSTSQLAASEQLTNEILAFRGYSHPTSDELAAADCAIKDLRDQITSMDSLIKVDVIGSRGTGLATPLSDIDINLTHPGGGNSLGNFEERNKAHTLLRSLWGKIPRPVQFMRNPTSVPIYSSLYVEAAQVPIITGVHISTNLQFQIQCTSDCFGSMEYTKAYLAEYPTLPALYLVLRQMLEMRGLNSGAVGGVGSYPLLIMIVAALKFSEGKFGRREVSKQLLFFLDMYSNIDFYTTGVSVSPLEYVVKRESAKVPVQKRLKSAPTAPDQQPHMSRPTELDEDDLEARKRFCVLRQSEPYLMCLQDPSNLTHDLGKSAKLIKHVQAVFVEANRRIIEAMNDWDATDWTWNQSSSDRKKSFAILDWCLGGDYEIYEHDRENLSEMGKTYGQGSSRRTRTREKKVTVVPHL